ncbi:MAG: MFS transporter [Actinomycetota bacterium]|nr:MFS transporter [Actinomycetota bacterium]
MTAPAQIAPSVDRARIPVPLFVGTAVLMLGAGLQNSLLGLRGVAEGFSSATISLLASVYFAGVVIGAVQVTGWIRRVGHVRAFGMLASVASVVVLCHALIVHPVPWLVGRFGSGLCISGLTVIVESWLNTASTTANRGRVLAIYMVVMLASMGGAQLLLNLSPVTDFVLFALVSAAFSLALLPLLMFTGPEPRVSEVKRLAIWDLARRTPVGFATALGGGATWGIAAGLGAVFAAESGLTKGNVTFFATALLAGGLLTQFPIGHLSDRYDRRVVVVGLALASATAGVAAAVAPFGSTVPLLVAGLALGATTLPLYSLAIAVSVEWVTEEEVVPASATLVVLSGLGSAAGPLMIAGLHPFVGRVTVPVVVTLVCAVIAVVAVVAVAIPRSGHHERKIAGLVPPRTTVAAALLAVSRRRPGRPPLPGGRRRGDRGGDVVVPDGEWTDTWYEADGTTAVDPGWESDGSVDAAWESSGDASWESISAVIDDTSAGGHPAPKAVGDLEGLVPDSWTGVPPVPGARADRPPVPDEQPAPQAERSGPTGTV